MDSRPTAPTVTINTATDGNGAAVAPGGTTTSPDITFAFSSPDADTASFACSTDGAAFIACTSPITYTGLGDGITHLSGTSNRYQW